MKTLNKKKQIIKRNSLKKKINKKKIVPIKNRRLL